MTWHELVIGPGLMWLAVRVWIIGAAVALGLVAVLWALRRR